MFLDEKQLRIKAGKGGDGAILFRREIYVPHGGPDGGDGGRGGDVVVVGSNNLHALVHLSPVDRIEAEDGAKGAHQRSTGKSGKETVVLVPLGTVVERQTEDGGWKLIKEIVDEGQPLLIARGGNGGWGNWHFKTSIQQSPERANPGLPGDSLVVRLELKLIADIGLVGLPNAGKSTLLSVISAARPKIADYPFTTLEPQLGAVRLGSGADSSQIVVADLPGLIEGASTGKGLGIKFLKHLERTKGILHCLDIGAEEEELAANYRTIRAELLGWSPELAQKPEMIVLTKSDTVFPEDAAARQAFMSKTFNRPVYLISAASHSGLDTLLTACFKLV